VKQILSLACRTGLLLIVGCAMVWAQATAEISGSARDQSGGVLPGVEITVTQTDTGITRSAITNETGSYVLPNLPVGPYRLEASLPGFRTYAQTGIVLQVNSSPVLNITLEVGQVAETVEVQANTALVETRSQGVGQVIENERILDLPLNGRNVTDLITLAGAAVQTGTTIDKFWAGSPIITVAGSPNSFGVEYNLDGAYHKNFASGLTMPMPFPDATQEFKVETSGLTAQRGNATAVDVVTKSGTNEVHGDLFEFVRNDLFNARQYFATGGSSLKRNQFGGTIGGPLVKSKLFYFAGYQGTTVRADPANNRAFVPTPAILAGDWTAFASPACNAGRQITLRAPFVNNRINPALYTRSSLYVTNKVLAGLSSPPINECGEVNYGSRTVGSEGFYVGKVDYQVSSKNSVFGRLMLVPVKRKRPMSFEPNNMLLSAAEGANNLAQMYTVGDTYLIGPNTVNAFRLSVNRAATLRLSNEFFSWCDAGVNIYCGWDPKKAGPVTITGGFNVGSATAPDTNIYIPTVYSLTDDVTLVKSAHQMSFGGTLVHARFVSDNHFASGGTYNINGQVTGLGLADFFLGNVNTFFQGAPNHLDVRQTFFSMYAADTWKVNPRLTMNYGLRWEPFLPLKVTNRQIYTFDLDRFHKGIKSTVYPKAPSGMVYPGEAGFPGLTGIYNQWKSFAPRLGFAWDVSGDGRTSLRASYAYSYLFVSGDWRDTLFGHAPFGHRVTLTSPPGGFEDPWRGIPGGNPFPYTLDASVVFPPSGIFQGVSYDQRTPRTSSWNLSIQRQVAGEWMLSASYIGTLTTHLWTNKPVNPATYFPGGPCTLNGVTYNPCSTTGNTDARRRFSLERPEDGKLMGFVSINDDGGTQGYQGMLLSVERRAARGVTVTANYTWSHCIGPLAQFNSMGPFGDETYTDPDNRDFDRGNCDTDRRYIFNLTSLAETPQFANPTLRMLGSGWKLSGIYRRSAGAPLNILAGSDRALNGVVRGSGPQRASQVLGDPYGDRSGRPLTNFLNPAAFTQPAAGTFGNNGRNSIKGPYTWAFDVSLSRSFRLREAQRLEVRAEAFNVTNSFRPGSPNQVLSNNTFGQLRTSDDPRILQFALKYVF